MPPPDQPQSKVNLVLIGYRGCGKSSVGRIIARQIGWDFLDTDELIERQAGRTIAAIFSADGETTFRKLERRAVEQSLRGMQQVISVGGGAVLSQGNRDKLRLAGVCVWLTAPPEELHRRLQADPHSATRRPALTASPGLEEVRRVLAERRSFYEAVADHVVDTVGQPTTDVARKVVELVSAELKLAEG